MIRLVGPIFKRSALLLGKPRKDHPVILLGKHFLGEKGRIVTDRINNVVLEVYSLEDLENLRDYFVVRNFGVDIKYSYVRNRFPPVDLGTRRSLVRFLEEERDYALVTISGDIDEYLNNLRGEFNFIINNNGNIIALP